MTVSFFLKHPANENGEHRVFLYTRIGKDQVKIYVPHMTVRESDWVTAKAKKGKRQRVKPQVRYAAQMNDTLDKMEAEIKGIVASILQEQKVVTGQEIKNRFEALTERGASHSEDKTFSDYWQDWLDQMESGTGANVALTIRQYRSTLNRFKNFATGRGTTLTFDRIDREFINSYSDYENRIRSLQNATLWNHIRRLKTFMGWAVENDLTTNTEFRKWTKKDFNVQEPPVIRLTETEFYKLADHDLSATPHLENARDLFVLQCSIGVRVGDLMKIIENPQAYLEGETIRLVSGKTKKQQTIPLNPRAKRILFSDNPPHKISDQKLNDYIKQAAKLAELNRMVTVPEFRGTTRKDLAIPLHEEISSHTAKRTFVSFLIAQDVHMQDIMFMTGNTLKTIQRYIDNDEQKVRKSMARVAVFH